MQFPTVDIIVVPRDRFSIFPQCLDALYANTEVPFRVFVICGGADKSTEDHLCELQLKRPNLLVTLRDHLLMQGEARNIGLQQVTERYCCILENDTIVHKNWLPPLLKCQREEGAAAVMPLILWYQRIHAAGCMFEEKQEKFSCRFNHKILYTGIHRKQIDYPECHCVLIDRKLVPDSFIFEDVEPFDVDLGLTFRKHGLKTFIEPSSVATYSALPRLEVCDIAMFKFRWGVASYEGRNRLFRKKWGVKYDPLSSKLASYRRQQLRLGFARWYPNNLTLWLSNLLVGLEKRVVTRFMPGDLYGPDTPRALFIDNEVNDFYRERVYLARRLQSAGFEVHVGLPPASRGEDISQEGIEVHPIYLRRTSTRLYDEVRSCVSLFRLYRRLRPTMVHHITLKPALYGGIAARIAGVPAMVSSLTGLGYLFTTRNLKVRFLRSVVTKGLRFAFGHQCHRVLFQNPEDRNCLLERCNLDSNHAVVIKGSGVNLHIFSPKPEPDGLPVVLMASRLLWTKGVGEFALAAQTLKGRGMKARFVLAGEPDPSHPSSVPAQVLEQWHNSGDLEWLGWRWDIRTVILQSHIICLPSYYGEGVPRVLIEAAASGRPIVTTDSPGCREVVRHEQNGLLIPAGDVKALEAAISRLVHDAPLRSAMGSRGREIAVSEFSIERVWQEHLMAYRSLLTQVGCRSALARCNDPLILETVGPPTDLITPGVILPVPKGLCKEGSQ
jgi:glycosyltransferase involved in cell wall biosynthesis